MSCHPAISSLVTYGTEGEQKLISLLSEVLHEPVTKTSGTFDTMDFHGGTTFSELKRRSSDFSYTDAKIKEEGWLMPAVKVMKGWEELSQGRRVFFFYFWMRDKSLWMYEMKQGDFGTIEDYTIPKHHYDKMLHVVIKEERWTRCPVDCTGIVFEEETCWIE